MCGNSWARWASFQACAPASGSTLTFSPQRQLLCPQDPSQLWKALPGENQLSPKLPQDGATNSRLGFCQLLQGEKRRTGQGVPGDSWAPLPQASSVPLRCDSGSSRVTLRALFSPLWQVPWFGSYLLLSVSLLLVSPCSSSSIPLHLPVSPSVSPFSSLHLCYLSSIFLSKSNAASSYTSPFKEKTLMCAYLLGCSGS